MKTKRFANLMFLGYLVLFLNLGPDWHRAPILGLHDHAHAADAVCSCGRDHGPVKSPDGQDHDQSVNKQPCDCSLCQFFRHFQVDCQCELPVLFKTNAWQDSFESFSQPTKVCISAKARAPPVV